MSDTLVRNLRLFARHPRLLLGVPRGKRGITMSHAAIEVKKAQELYQISQAASLLELFEKFDRKLCTDYKNCFLYAFVRKIRPCIVVETGVASGVSSYSILQALQDNDQGSLYSIDIPNQDEAENIQLPEGQETGFLIPKSLRKRWNLRAGDSKLELPRLLEQLGEIDLFIHDSLHEYNHMMFEYREAILFK